MSTGRLPDFIVIGAMKAGTTTLFGQLAQHPDVFVPQTKELDFFCIEKNWSRGIDWYREQFVGAPPTSLAGEASTSYTKAAAFPGVPKRLHDTLPKARLIYILRDPVARMRSQYAHLVASGYERLPAEQAITATSDYLDTSLYGAQLSRYFDHFPQDQLLVVQTEALRDNPVEVMGRVYRFLGLKETMLAEPELRLNETSKRRAYGSLGGMIRRHPSVLAVAEKVLPRRMYSYARIHLSHDIRPEEISVPDHVIAKFASTLSEDRRLLASLCNVDLSYWTPI